MTNSLYTSQPILEQFGITDFDVEFYKNHIEYEKKLKKSLSNSYIIIIGISLFFIFKFWLEFGVVFSLSFTVIIPIIFKSVYNLIISSSSKNQNLRRKASNIKVKYEMYLSEVNKYQVYCEVQGEQRKREREEEHVKRREIELKGKELASIPDENLKTLYYWRHLNPYQFERSLKILFEKKGYSGMLTPASGDKGIDIFLWKNNNKYVVQCKYYRWDRVKPDVARDIMSAMESEKADGAILICMEGYTKGVIELAEQNPKLKLMTLSEIISFAKDEFIL